MRIVSVAPSGPAVRALTRPFGPPSPKGLTARQFCESKDRARPIPSSEGCRVAAGWVWVRRPARGNPPRPSATPPERGFSDAFPPDFRSL